MQQSRSQVSLALSAVRLRLPFWLALGGEGGKARPASEVAQCILFPSHHHGHYDHPLLPPPPEASRLRPRRRGMRRGWTRGPSAPPPASSSSRLILLPLLPFGDQGARCVWHVPDAVQLVQQLGQSLHSRPSLFTGCGVRLNCIACSCRSRKPKDLNLLFLSAV
jgi:hypothetical protein